EACGGQPLEQFDGAANHGGGVGDGHRLQGLVIGRQRRRLGGGCCGRRRARCAGRGGRGGRGCGRSPREGLVVAQGREELPGLGFLELDPVVVCHIGLGGNRDEGHVGEVDLGQAV